MPSKKNPRRGSLQFWPRKRAKKETARVRAWNVAGEAKLAGFAGYKAGMTQIHFIDTRKNSPTAKDLVSIPCTIVECPPLKFLSLRLYKKNVLGQKRLINEYMNPKLDKDLSRKIVLPKKQSQIDFDKLPEFDELRVTMYTQPKLTGFGKKKPAILEMAVAGDKASQINYLKENFDKEISVEDIFKTGQLVDSHSVTIGKGHQGVVKRFGVKIRQAKAEKTKRGAVLAPESPGKVTYRAPQAGKMGYHLRTDYNKWLVKIAKPSDSDTPIDHYGNVKNSYVLVKGSIPGPKKRLITLTNALRPNKKLGVPVPELKN